MSNSEGWCQVFVTEVVPGACLYSVQFQLPALTVTMVARDLLFAAKLIEFVEETRGNPDFRDVHLGGGRYRRTPETSVDLSASFPETGVVLIKDGESDSRFFLRVEPCASFWTTIDFCDGQVDALLDGLKEVIDEFVNG